MTTLTLDEMNQLLQFADAAVRAGGIQTALQAVPIIHKLQMMAVELQQSPASALKPIEEPTEEPVAA